MKRNTILWLLCTLYSTWEYLVMSLAPCVECFDKLDAIATFQGDPPFVYRILAPMILQALGNTPQAWAGFQFVCIAIFYFLLWQWARHWRVSPVIVMLLTVMVFSIMMPTFYFSAYKFLEWDLWLFSWLYLLRLSSSAR